MATIVDRVVITGQAATRPICVSTADVTDPPPPNLVEVEPGSR